MIVQAIQVLPDFDLDALTTKALNERALVLLTVLGNAYDWGDRESSLTIPAKVAIRLCAMAQTLDRPAIAHDGAMRHYMPVGHLAFVNDIEKYAKVRSRVALGSPALLAAYNVVLQQISVFRKIHLWLVYDYIMIPSGMAENAKGTGGTNTISFLSKSRTDTIKMKLRYYP